VFGGLVLGSAPSALPSSIDAEQATAGDVIDHEAIVYCAREV
jgi:hypothetical protein